MAEENPLGRVAVRVANIADGASLSASVLTRGGQRILWIQQPAACEGTRFLFEGDPGDGTFYGVFDNAGARLFVQKSATAAQALALPENLQLALTGFVNVRLQSADDANVAVVQAGLSTLRIAVGVI